MIAFIQSLHLQELNEISIVVRFFLAAVLSGVLGLERARKRRAAGFRTYILVCLGAALVVMTGEFIAIRFPEKADPTRIAAQVVSGIGFLGAGTIIMTGAKQIRGLTTAAGLWASACMGIAIGAGFYFAAIAMFVFMFLVMTTFEYLQSVLVSRSKRIHLYAVFETMENITQFLQFATEKNFKVKDFYINRPDFTAGVGVVLMLHFATRLSHSEVMQILSEFSGIKFIEEI